MEASGFIAASPFSSMDWHASCLVLHLPSPLALFTFPSAHLASAQSVSWLQLGRPDKDTDKVTGQICNAQRRVTRAEEHHPLREMR